MYNTQGVSNTTLERNSTKRRKRKKMKKKKKKPVCSSCVVVVSMWLWFRPFTVWIVEERIVRQAKKCSLSFMYMAYELLATASHMHIETKCYMKNSIYTVNQIDLNAQQTNLTSLHRFQAWILVQHVCAHLLGTRILIYCLMYYNINISNFKIATDISFGPFVWKCIFCSSKFWSWKVLLGQKISILNTSNKKTN